MLRDAQASTEAAGAPGGNDADTTAIVDNIVQTRKDATAPARISGRGHDCRVTRRPIPAGQVAGTRTTTVISTTRVLHAAPPDVDISHLIINGCVGTRGGGGGIERPLRQGAEPVDLDEQARMKAHGEGRWARTIATIGNKSRRSS